MKKLLQAVLGRRAQPQPESDVPQDAGDTSARADVSASLTPEHRLAAAEGAPVGPEDLSKPPVVVTDPVSVDASRGIAKADAAAPGFDQHTIGPVLPAAPIMDRWSRAMLDRVKERAWDVVQAWETRTLGQVQPREVRHTIAVKALVIFGLIVTAGVVTEIVYGQNAAQILTGATPQWALLGALGFTIAINLLAYAAAGIVHATYPAILHNRGLRIGTAALVMILILAAILGLVVGGFDPAEPVGGGITGGGATTTESITNADTRPLLAAAYFGILATIAYASFLSHLLYLHEANVRHVQAIKNAQRDARDASLDDHAQRRTASAMLQAHIEAIPAAHAHGRGLIAAYNATVRRYLDPDLNGKWTNLTYDDTDPEWIIEITNKINQINEADPPSHLTVVA